MQDDGEASESTTLLGDEAGQHGSVSRREYAQIAASRVLNSRQCGAFYVSLLAASLFELAWILHPWFLTCTHPRATCSTWMIAYPKSPIFLAVEVYLTCGLVAETAVRAVWLGASEFAKEPCNVFDAVVGLLSVLSFALYVERSSEDLEVQILSLAIPWLT